MQRCTLSDETGHQTITDGIALFPTDEYCYSPMVNLLKSRYHHFRYSHRLDARYRRVIHLDESLCASCHFSNQYYFVHIFTLICFPCFLGLSSYLSCFYLKEGRFSTPFLYDVSVYIHRKMVSIRIQSNQNYFRNPYTYSYHALVRRIALQSSFVITYLLWVYGTIARHRLQFSIVSYLGYHTCSLTRFASH